MALLQHGARSLAERALIEWDTQKKRRVPQYRAERPRAPLPPDPRGDTKQGREPDKRPLSTRTAR